MGSRDTHEHVHRGTIKTHGIKVGDVFDAYGREAIPTEQPTRVKLVGHGFGRGTMTYRLLDMSDGSILDEFGLKARIWADVSGIVRRGEPLTEIPNPTGAEFLDRLAEVTAERFPGVDPIAELDADELAEMHEQERQESGRPPRRAMPGDHTSLGLLSAMIGFYVGETRRTGHGMNTHERRCQLNGMATLLTHAVHVLYDEPIDVATEHAGEMIEDVIANWGDA